MQLTARGLADGVACPQAAPVGKPRGRGASGPARCSLDPSFGKTPAAQVRDESGEPHQIEVVQRSLEPRRVHYQLVVDGFVLSRGNRAAPNPSD